MLCHAIVLLVIPLVIIAFVVLLVRQAIQRILSNRKDGLFQCEVVALLTEAEKHFYRHLIQVFNGQVVICPKVRLGDVVQPHGSIGRKAIWTARNRINQKHLDFVCLRADDLTTVGVIELDDRSHEREDRKERDRLVDQALATASIPICHVRTSRAYDVTALSAQIAADFGWTT